MIVLTFLALWFVAGVVAVAVVITALWLANGGEQDTEALDLWDNWDHQSARGGW